MDEEVGGAFERDGECEGVGQGDRRGGGTGGEGVVGVGEGADGEGHKRGEGVGERGVSQQRK